MPGMLWSVAARSGGTAPPRHDLERSAREGAQSRLAAALAGASEGFVLLDAENRVVTANERVRELLPGVGAALEPGVRFADALLLAPAAGDFLPEAADAERTLGAFLAGERHEARLVEFPVAGDGWLSLSATRLDNGDAVIVCTDISRRKRAERQLMHDAFHDGLTGLANRSLFMDRLAHLFQLRERDAGLRFAVLYLDIDRFKTLNDSLGHAVGDALLMTIGRRLADQCRAGDTVARLGGDEFAILLRDLAVPADGERFAERLLDSLGEPVRLFGQEIDLSASIGLVHSGGHAASALDMMRDADVALYRAKDTGRSRYVVFNDGMRVDVIRRLVMETDLRRALSQDQFVMHYQPIVRLADERIVGFEALVRWQHPERGLIPPGDFIPVAEETGSILAIGERALAQALAQGNDWAARQDVGCRLVLSVNLSARQIYDTRDVDRLPRTIPESGFDPGALRLEVTETSIIDRPEQAAQMLARFKLAGVSLSLDDFGTGYSSFSYLHRLPFDVLKIDRSFISRIGQGSRDLSIVRAIAGVAHDLGMEVVAEGIETAETATASRSVGIEYGQGYHFARPMPADAATRLLDAAPRNVTGEGVC